MSRRRAWGIGLGLLVVLLVSVAVAAPPKDAMVIGLLAEPVTMDPPQITDLNSTRVIKRMFDRHTVHGGRHGHVCGAPAGALRLVR